MNTYNQLNNEYIQYQLKTKSSITDCCMAIISAGIICSNYSN